MKKKTVVIIISSIAALVILLLCLLSQCSEVDGGKGLSFNPDIPEEWSGNIEAQGSEGIKIPGFNKIYFEAGTNQVQLTLANPADNTCYFIYELFLNDPEGEKLYSSCRIDPGMALTDITVSRSLEEGAYTLYIKVNPCDLDSGAPLNAALLKVPLIVIK